VVFFLGANPVFHYKLLPKMPIIELCRSFFRSFGSALCTSKKYGFFCKSLFISIWAGTEYNKKSYLDKDSFFCENI